MLCIEEINLVQALVLYTRYKGRGTELLHKLCSHIRFHLLDVPSLKLLESIEDIPSSYILNAYKAKVECSDGNAKHRGRKNNQAYNMQWDVYTAPPSEDMVSFTNNCRTVTNKGKKDIVNIISDMELKVRDLYDYNAATP